MSSVRDHYESLLAEHYTWMAGGFDDRVADADRIFRAHGVAPRSSGLAIDLGSGSGFQSVALARLGFRVIAIDLSPTLLREIDARRGELDITCVESDLVRFDAIAPSPADAILCMGDTLTHLDSAGSVSALCRTIARTLASDGLFVATFRDLTRPLEGVDRIIPVRADDTTVFTCFLEYLADRVWVHDVVHTRTADGWTVKKSAYPKLRLSGDGVAGWLEDAGLTIRSLTTTRGLVELVASR